MQLARVVATAALVLTPALAHATTYRLDAVVSGAPQGFGAVSIDDTIVASGSLGLTKLCQTAGSCTLGGPWDQVAFNLSGPLQASVLGTGAGTVDNFSLNFDTNGDVIGGGIFVQGAEGQPNVPYLSATLGFTGLPGGVGPGTCSSNELCGTYIPVMFADPEPISITFVQQAALAGGPNPIPEPNLGLTWLLAFGGLAAFAGVRR